MILAVAGLCPVFVSTHCVAEGVHCWLSRCDWLPDCPFIPDRDVLSLLCWPALSVFPHHSFGTPIWPVFVISIYLWLMMIRWCLTDLVIRGWWPFCCRYRPDTVLCVVVFCISPTAPDLINFIILYFWCTIMMLFIWYLDWLTLIDLHLFTYVWRPRDCSDDILMTAVGSIDTVILCCLHYFYFSYSMILVIVEYILIRVVGKWLNYYSIVLHCYDVIHVGGTFLRYWHDLMIFIRWWSSNCYFNFIAHIPIDDVVPVSPTHLKVFRLMVVIRVIVRYFIDYDIISVFWYIPFLPTHLHTPILMSHYSYFGDTLIDDDLTVTDVMTAIRILFLSVLKMMYFITFSLMILSFDYHLLPVTPFWLFSIRYCRYLFWWYYILFTGTLFITVRWPMTLPRF